MIRDQQHLSHVDAVRVSDVVDLRQVTHAPPITRSNTRQVIPIPYGIMESGHRTRAWTRPPTRRHAQNLPRVDLVRVPDPVQVGQGVDRRVEARRRSPKGYHRTAPGTNPCSRVPRRLPTEKLLPAPAQQPAPRTPGQSSRSWVSRCVSSTVTSCVYIILLIGSLSNTLSGILIQTPGGIPRQ